MAARYLIGIDLGTTNSVVAYIDTQGDSAIHVFPVPQLVAHGEVQTLPALPSFLYFPTQDELSSGVVSATWDEDPPMVTGVHAREMGALVPARQVSSAKSWLSVAGVDRRAAILPAQAEPPQPTISPVEASARYLMHLRDAWNAAPGRAEAERFERQDIVLTVPASFDEEARELTVEAARRAGLENLTLLEEPLAAFYAWIDSSASSASSALKPDDLILICDIGGGTSDFSLVRARGQEGEIQFERTAIGEHLLLGGDNLDYALARVIEEKLKSAKLTLRQRYALRRACSAAKERLLGDPPVESVPVTILGSGRAVVGQALTVELTREEVLKVLTRGFLPITAPDELPARGRATALRELGLPYASDPAITKHLAAFLTQAAVTIAAPPTSARIWQTWVANSLLARPDAVLFNGGFCTPAVTRERIVDAIAAWFQRAEPGWRPKVLHNEAVDSAVARGAAYYGRVRRGAGLRIRAGSARTYYIGLRAEEGLHGICVLPAGVEEGTTLPPLEREFAVIANRPASFTLYSSRLRHDREGELVALEEGGVHRHAPLVTLLRYGKKLRDAQLTVRLRASFTEVGTLELWCEARETPHRWRLQFDLRGAEGQAQSQHEGVRSAAVPAAGPAESDATAVESATELIRRCFGQSDDPAPDRVVGEMEAALGMKRDAWPVSAARQFCDVLIEVAPGRAKSARHELRWLSLAGFCLRPGFGAPEDAKRVGQVRRIAGQLGFADDLQCQIELLVLLRRVAGGINASDQQALYRRYGSLVSAGKAASKKRRVNRQLEYDAWRLVASLEHLPASTRASLGRELLARIKSGPEDAISLWCLGRLGARIPLYGPLHSVVAPEMASAWLKELFELPLTAAVVSAILQLARRTEDRARDIDETLRSNVIARLNSSGAGAEAVESVAEYVSPSPADAARSFGESLPPGLELVSSAQCLLSVPALHGSAPTATLRAL